MTEFVEFGEIINLSKGRKHTVVSQKSANSKRFIQIDDLRNNDAIKYTNDPVGVEASQDDLLITWDGANAGTVGWGLSGFIGSTITLIRLKDKNAWSTPFLGFFLRSKFAVLRANATGATIPHLSRSILEGLKIPLFDLTTQCQIAYLLSRAENLVTTRQQSLALLDDFLKSTFLNLFGDPMKNEKGWPVEKLGSVIENIVAGDSYGGEERPLLENELGVLKISAVTSGVFKPEEFKAVPKKIIKKPVIFPRKGDILFSRANTRELVGAICIVDKDYDNVFLPDKLWRIDFKEQECQPAYFKYVFAQERFKNKLTSVASGTSGSMLNISMEKLRAFSIPLPSFSTQKQFTTIVDRVNALKTRQRVSLVELQNLYQSLLQRAFAGELDTNNVAFLVETAEPIQETGMLPVEIVDELTLTDGQAEQNDVPSLTSHTALIQQLQERISNLATRLPFEQIRQEFPTIPYQQLRDTIFEGLQTEKLGQEFVLFVNVDEDDAYSGHVMLTSQASPT